MCACSTKVTSEPKCFFPSRRSGKKNNRVFDKLNIGHVTTCTRIPKDILCLRFRCPNSQIYNILRLMSGRTDVPLRIASTRSASTSSVDYDWWQCTVVQIAGVSMRNCRWMSCCTGHKLAIAACSRAKGESGFEYLTPGSAIGKLNWPNLRQWQRAISPAKSRVRGSCGRTHSVHGTERFWWHIRAF